MIKNVFIFGFGYCGQAYAQLLVANGYHVFGTSRNAELRKRLTQANVTLIDFSTYVEKFLGQSQAILVCIPPNAKDTDPVLNKFKQQLLKHSKTITWIGYLSSTGVYGDHQGKWVTEESPCNGVELRAQKRLDAEHEWLSLYHQAKLPIHIFRLPGIYGPNRNSLDKILAGKNKSVFKPEHMFSRIHVSDISHALLKSMQNPTPDEIYNLSDDCPAPAHKVEAYAALLLHLPKPQLIPFEEANLSTMGKSFFKSNRKVSNKKIKSKLKIQLKYPTYKEGLATMSKTINKTGILLINLGTPDDTSQSAIRRYLRDFLSEPRVIDINPVARWLLLNAIILPFRTPKTARAYQKVWTKNGSPLMVNSINLTNDLRQVNNNIPTELGMCYGSPSIKNALNKLIEQHVEHIKIVPLYPQYASSTIGPAVEKTMKLLNKRQAIPSFELIPPFYQHPEYIDVLAQSIKPPLDKIEPEYLLLSYHGLPERQLDKLENTECCNRQEVCAPIQTNNRFCYRAQCYQTSRLLAQNLNLNQDQYGVSFQSRLGKIPWIKPYTENILTKLRQQNIKKIAIACPAFVADCLETIEEIGMEAKEQWLDLGGTEFTLIPCLNDNPIWVQALNKIIDVRR